MKDSSFIFDHVHLLYYKCDKINPNSGGSYKDYPDWIKTKKAVIDSINLNDNKSFQYAATIALNNKKIGKDSGRIRPLN